MLPHFGVAAAARSFIIWVLTVMTYCHIIIFMILIGRKIIADFGVRHPQSRKPLSAWEEVMRLTDYGSFNELKLLFRSVDYVYHCYTIFDIRGNKYRLITEIDYDAGVVQVKRVWTHAEYSMKKNEDALRGGKL